MSLPPLADSSDYAALIGPVPAGADVDQLCVNASAKVRAFCGWVVAPSFTEVLVENGSGTFRQFLKTMHLTNVVSVVDSGVALDVTRLDWAVEGWLEWSQGSAYARTFSRRPRGVVATVTHGYSDVPDDVRQLVCEMVARHVASPTGIVSAQVGQESVSYSQSSPGVAGGVRLLASEMADLAAYRIPRVR